MPLELRKNKDGTLRSKWWYGTFTVNGKRHVENLGVPVRGVPPPGFSLKKTGDTTFEVGKAKAEDKLDALVMQARSGKAAQEHLKALYELKAGEEVGSVLLADICDKWDQANRRRQRSVMYRDNVHAIIKEFVQFVQTRHPKVTTMATVTPRVARDWAASLEGQNLAPATFNDKITRIRSVFKALTREAGLAHNPFTGIESRQVTMIHREPFTPAELRKLVESAEEIDNETRAKLDAAKDSAAVPDEESLLIKPIILCGICTAMRCGDCCQLKWSDVDLKNRFITVRTSKTGKTAEIPLFEKLHVELKQTPREGEYVWPVAARLYTTRRYCVAWRIRKVLSRAKIKTQRKASDGRQQKASVKDFHSFRTTWITLALSAGIPMELVRRVTGHSTVNIVLDHYFRPGRDDFRKAIEKAMPKMLGEAESKDKGQASVADLLSEALDLLQTVPSNALLTKAIALLHTAKGRVETQAARN